MKELAGLKSLQELKLGHTHVTDKGLQALAELQSLRTLHLESTRVTDAGVAELQRALSTCEIRR
jgi:hypothetical protein